MSSPLESLCAVSGQDECVFVKWMSGEWMAVPWESGIIVWQVKVWIEKTHGISPHRQSFFDDDTVKKLGVDDVLEKGARLFLFVQPEVHPFALEYCTYLVNYSRYARDEIIDRLDLDDCGTYLVLRPPKQFSDWTRYFDQFPRFFSQRGFKGDSVVAYTEESQPVTALKQYINTIIESDRHNFETDFTILLREIDYLSRGMAVENIAEQRSMLWDMAMREHHKYDYFTEMAFGTYAMLMAALTRVCRGVPFQELENASAVLVTHDDVVDRINREHDMEWDDASMSSVLRYLTHQEIRRIRE